MVTEVSIMVANALVRDAIELENKAPERVTVYVDQPFRVRFSYRVLEMSPLEEKWRFKLAANLAGEDDAVSEVRHRDRRIFKDNFIANVSQDHVVPEPGEYELTWDAEAELLIGDWDSNTPPKTQDLQRTSGRIIIEAVNE